MLTCRIDARGQRPQGAGAGDRLTMPGSSACRSTGRGPRRSRSSFSIAAGASRRPRSSPSAGPSIVGAEIAGGKPGVALEAEQRGAPLGQLRRRLHRVGDRAGSVSSSRRSRRRRSPSRRGRRRAPRVDLPDPPAADEQRAAPVEADGAGVGEPDAARGAISRCRASRSWRGALVRGYARSASGEVEDRLGPRARSAAVIAPLVGAPRTQAALGLVAGQRVLPGLGRDGGHGSAGGSIPVEAVSKRPIARSRVPRRPPRRGGRRAAAAPRASRARRSTQPQTRPGDLEIVLDPSPPAASAGQLEALAQGVEIGEPGVAQAAGFGQPAGLTSWIGSSRK